MASLSNQVSDELRVFLYDTDLLTSRCLYFEHKRNFLTLIGSNEDLWRIVIPAEEMSLSDTAVLLHLCSCPDFDALGLCMYDLDFLIQFSDFFDCDFLLIEYFHFFISRDLTLTIRDFFRVLCHYSIDHPIVRTALLCYSNRLNLDYSMLSSLLISGDPNSKYAIYKFKRKLRDAYRSMNYRNRIVYGTCQVGRHPMVILPSKQLTSKFYMKWGVMLQCCGSIVCRKCYDWIFTRVAEAFYKSTTCPVCRNVLDIDTGEYLWEYCEVLEARDRGRQLELNGMVNLAQFLPVPLRPLPQPTNQH